MYPLTTVMVLTSDGSLEHDELFAFTRAQHVMSYLRTMVHEINTFVNKFTA